MFDRYDEDARDVVTIAHGEALAQGHREIGALHLLLGCYEAKSADSARVLHELGITRGEILEVVSRHHMVALTEAGEVLKRRGQMPFTDDAKAILERSLSESLRHGHTTIRPGHLLLCLLAHPHVLQVLDNRIRTMMYREWAAGAS